MNEFVRVVFPLPITQMFLYKVPDSCSRRALPGTRVLAPLGSRLLMGFVVELAGEPQAETFEVKNIRDILDERPVFDPSLLDFTRRLSEYFDSSWGEMLQTSLPPALGPGSRTRIFLTESGRAALTRGDLRGLEGETAALLGGRPLTARYLRIRLGASHLPEVVDRMEKKGFIGRKEVATRPRRRRRLRQDGGPAQLELSFPAGSGSVAASAVVERFLRETGRFARFLLWGQLSSREGVYFRLIGKTLDRGGRALLLVPEIRLAGSLIGRLERHLGGTAALFHSRLSESRKEEEWRKLEREETGVLVGVRSALFSSLAPIRLIILDEEQDESYFQTESPVYDARHGAVLRGQEEGAVVVFGSARPSVESFYAARQDGGLLELERETRNAHVYFVDDRGGRSLVSRFLRDKIADRLNKGEPVLVFLNRRGYASFLACRRCGHVPRCRRCDIVLSYHKREGKLLCHYCNAALDFSASCPLCGGRLTARTGAGIQALSEELAELFPGRRVAVFDSDVVRGRRQAEDILEAARKGRIEILVGTQLLAHQTGLPKVSLVGILSPEIALAMADYRASQRAFQTVSRMLDVLAAEGRPEAVIQTSLPDHFSIQAAASGDYESFYRQEIAFREVMNYPPFSRLAEVLLMGDSLRTLAERSRTLTDRLKKLSPEVEVLGPALASASRVKGVYRVQIILKTADRGGLDRALEELTRIGGKKSVLIS